MKALISATAIAAALLSVCSTQQPQTNADMAKAGAGAHSTPTKDTDGTLIGPDGRTLYVYSRDARGSGKSACVDQCAANWPPLGVASTAQSIGEYTVITRADGNKQWAYKGMPLYYFAKDAKPGDKLGQGVGGVWAVARP